ncbi:hypothetical protein EJB05_23561, partial [Eragrostis curvula]
METPRRNLSAAIFVVIVLLMSPDMERAQAPPPECYYLSGTFSGLCVWSSKCAAKCRNEPSKQRPGQHYDGGVCMDIPSRCWCSEPCCPCKKASTATMPYGGQGDGARAHD